MRAFIDIVQYDMAWHKKLYLHEKQILRRVNNCPSKMCRWQTIGSWIVGKHYATECIIDRIDVGSHQLLANQQIQQGSSAEMCVSVWYVRYQKGDICARPVYTVQAAIGIETGREGCPRPHQCSAKKRELNYSFYHQGQIKDRNRLITRRGVKEIIENYTGESGLPTKWHRRYVGLPLLVTLQGSCSQLAIWCKLLW